MAIKYLSSLDLSGLELKKLRVENFSTANEPTGIAAGHVYFNTTDSKLNVYDGAAWVEVGSSILAGDGISVDADGVTINVDSTVVRTSGDQSVNGTLSMTGLIVDGAVTIKGDYVMTAPETVNIQDNLILLNSNVGAEDEPVEDAGIEVSRGAQRNVSIQWIEEEDVWKFTNDGDAFFVIPTPTDISNAVSAAVRTDNEIKDLAGGLISGATLTGLGATYNSTTNALAITNQYLQEFRQVEGTEEPYIYSLANFDNSFPVSITVYELDEATQVRTLVLTDVVIDVAARTATLTLAPTVQYQLLIVGYRA